MKGSETWLMNFMEGKGNRFIIPVYQRSYDWKQEHCRQLYDDLIKVVRQNRPSHFFGSIVCAVEGNGARTNYNIIDGQQRLTTVTLLLLAMRNLLRSGLADSAENHLDQQIEQYIISPWASENDRIKLRPVKTDRAAFEKLFGSAEDYDQASNLTHNYNYFYTELQKSPVSIDELYNAICKLEVICITLDLGDNAQLIFESLNSTGLALDEGDKIRNYVLMSQPLKEQNRLYDTYWLKIERCTQGDVSAFVRDYLSIKMQTTPTVKAVYQVFKRYAEDSALSIESLLEDMLSYARLYEKLLTCKSDLSVPGLDDCLYRMKRLEITVTRPYLMEVFRLNQEGKLPAGDVLKVFLIVETYLFRRNICEVPTNALNKIFLTLNREILRYDGGADRYVDKLVYDLLAKRDSGRFPDDGEFAAALAGKQVYLMRGRYKDYIFERFENYGTVEVKDVYTLLDTGIYSIEHIMPQHLTPAWAEDLGTDYAQIHDTWQHRLANLTLSGYNPHLSNATFIEKRDDPDGGYKASGLRINQRLAQLERWTLPEIEARSRELVEHARDKIWAYPKTDFVPARRELDSCSLGDEDADLTGRWVQKYSFFGVEQPVSNWSEVFVQVLKQLHQRDKSVLYSLASVNDADGVSVYFSYQPNSFHSPVQVDANLYVEKNTSTNTKLNILRRVFSLYGVDADELVFYLHDADVSKAGESGLRDRRLAYWTYALPLIQMQNINSGAFSSVNPGVSNTITGYFGVAGLSVRCIANFDAARAEFVISLPDLGENQALFDRLLAHRQEIESGVGTALSWERAGDNKASVIGCAMDGVSVTNETDWPAMAKFHAEWSERLCSVLLPYLVDENSREVRLMRIAGALRRWAVSRPEIKLSLAKSSRSCTRFTTETMSVLLPDAPEALSGWNTPNHYFYEIVNRDGENVRIQLSFSAHNIPDTLRAQCERIDALTHIDPIPTGWQWRVTFKTSSVPVADPIDEAALFAGLDGCLNEVRAFEGEALAAIASISRPGE